jgi:hypothetical protein
MLMPLLLLLLVMSMLLLLLFVPRNASWAETPPITVNKKRKTFMIFFIGNTSKGLMIVTLFESVWIQKL